MTVEELKLILEDLPPEKALWDVKCVDRNCVYDILDVVVEQSLARPEYSVIRIDIQST
nr:MAG TPA: hypothetical protein [Caudoviricetes sp.]